MAKTTELSENGTGEVQTTPVSKVYPIVEDMQFRAIINSEDEGYALLKAVQTIVNSVGSTQLIAIVDKFEKNPKMVQQIKVYLPYILSL